MASNFFVNLTYIVSYLENPISLYATMENFPVQIFINA